MLFTFLLWLPYFHEFLGLLLLSGSHLIQVNSNYLLSFYRNYYLGSRQLKSNVICFFSKASLFYYTFLSSKYQRYLLKGERIKSDPKHYAQAPLQTAHRVMEWELLQKKFHQKFFQNPFLGCPWSVWWGK